MKRANSRYQKVGSDIHDLVRIEVKKMYGFFRSHKFALLYYQLKLSLFSSEIGMWYELERLKIEWTLSITSLNPHEQLNF